MGGLNVTLCSVNSKYAHSSLAPWCLLAGVREYSHHSHSVRVVDGTINETVADVVDRICVSNPDLVGFCCYIWNIEFVKSAVVLLKQKLPDCTVVFGGPEVSYNVKEVFDCCDDVDFVISGEGELPFALLCDAVYDNGNFSINGVNSRLNLSSPFITSKTPPSPYCDEYFSALQSKISYIETSRGCPYSCAFCLSGRCGNVRYFDIERVKSEILLLAKSGTKTIKFVDRTFNANKKRAKEIVRFIIDNYNKEIPQGVCFHFEIAGDILDDELISHFNFAPSGLIQLEIGMQSFNEHTLKEINRKTDCKVLKENIKKLISVRNMHIHIDLIAGLPFEDMKSFENSFDTAFNLRSDMLQLGFLKLLHGAPMRDFPEKFPCEYRKTPPYEVISTPYMSADELLFLHKVEDVLERTYNSGRFILTLDYLLSLGYTPFRIFCKIAENIFENDCKTLDIYTERLFEIIANFENVDKSVLRDVMLLDRICSVADTNIPKCLRISDPFLKTAKHFLAKKFPTRKNVMRNVVILYSDKSVCFVDYTAKNQITGRYDFAKIPFENIEKLTD